MTCCGEREKFGDIKNEQKWTYINLDDFKSDSCGAPFSYGFLWFLLFVSIGVYVVDIFVAYNLLFFDRWSGQVQPVIRLHISRWIFVGCIILSFVLLVYRWMRALRVMRSGSITKSYLDPLAVRVQSVRMGKEGRGWRRFLVFAALTKGRKGAEYVALFTYFTFEAWLRIVFAEGPRQVLNALTLYSVLNAKLIPVGHNAPKDGHTPVVQFFVNISILAGQNKQQAVVLFGMLYTLIIWVFSALSLILAVLFYLLFLWHHIPSADGGLTKYCKRKIEKRLHKIVMATVNKALDKQDKKRAVNDLAKPGFLGTATSDVKRQPTLPNMDDESLSLSRRTTQSDFVPFAPRPLHGAGIERAPSPLQTPTLPDLDTSSQRPVIPSRQTTQSSINSIASRGSSAPLLGSAAPPGSGGHPPGDPAIAGRRPPPSRAPSGFSARSQDTYSSQPSRMGPPRRQNTDMSGVSSQSGFAPRSQSRPGSHRDHSMGPGPPRSMQPPLAQAGRPSQEFEMRPPRSASAMSNRTAPPPGGPPKPFTPYRPYQPRLPTAPAIRNFTSPQRSYIGSGVPDRSGTAPLPEPGGYHESIIDAYSAEESRPQHPPARPATAGPGPTYTAYRG